MPCVTLAIESVTFCDALAISPAVAERFAELSLTSVLLMIPAYAALT